MKDRLAEGRNENVVCVWGGKHDPRFLNKSASKRTYNVRGILMGEIFQACLLNILFYYTYFFYFLISSLPKESSVK